MSLRQFDLLDIIASVACLIVVAQVVQSGGSLSISIIMVGLWVIQHKVRASGAFSDLIDQMLNGAGEQQAQIVRELLLPPPPEDDHEEPVPQLPQKASVFAQFQEAVKPVRVELPQPNTGETIVMHAPTTPINALLKKLPKQLSLNEMGNAPSPLSVPLGHDAHTNQRVWVDFGAEGEGDNRVIHVLVAGNTGSGKDNLLRDWYYTLTTNNDPSAVQFVIVDGKIDWLMPEHRESPYMALPPVGGTEIQLDNGKWINVAEQRIDESLSWILVELNRRTELFKRAGVISVERYRKVTGETLPTLFIMASDIGNTFDGKLELLVNLLATQGRSYGIRLIISLQDPVGLATRWRNQMSLILCGSLTLSGKDHLVMGISNEAMLVRPSQLPTPDGTGETAGIFVARLGHKQYLVKTPYISDQMWEHYTREVLPVRNVRVEQLLPQVDPLLMNLLAANVTEPLPELPTVTLSAEQCRKIMEARRTGSTKTDIMRIMGWTSSTRYATYSPLVDELLR